MRSLSVAGRKNPRAFYMDAILVKVRKAMFSDIERYENFIHHLPDDIKDKTFIALKGHLLLETCLREYILNRVPHPERLRNKQFNFSVLIDFASSLENNNKIQWVWKALKIANQIRNQLAHNLEPEKVTEYENQFIKYVEENDGEFSVSTDKPLMYEKLALVFFQLFDVLAREVDVRNLGCLEKSIAMERATSSFTSIIESLKLVAEATEVKRKHSRYEPQYSKKRPRKW